jgi:hypothetical protein
MNLASLTTASVFAVAFWGLTALLLTGELNPLALLACYVLLGGAYLLRSGRHRLSNPVWNILTLAAFTATLSVAFRSFFDATVYFFMYLQLAKLFNRRTGIRPQQAAHLPVRYYTGIQYIVQQRNGNKFFLQSPTGNDAGRVQHMVNKRFISTAFGGPMCSKSQLICLAKLRVITSPRYFLAYRLKLLLGFFR